MKNELFIISPAAIAACDDEVLLQTVKDLIELDLLRLPYPKIDLMALVDWTQNIIIPKGTDVSALSHLLNSNGFIEFTSKSDSCLALRVVGMTIEVDKNKEVCMTYDAIYLDLMPPRYRAYTQGIRTIDYMVDQWHNAVLKLGVYLITLLATRNVVKQVEVNKLARLGIGTRKGTPSKHSYPRVTTILVPHDLPDDEDHATQGKPKAPHLRRGHIRHQHYGPENALTKQVWIAPIFVNADEDFVSSRIRYNLRGTSHAA